MTTPSDYLITIHISQSGLNPPFKPIWAASNITAVLMVSFGISRDEFTKLVSHRFPGAEILFSHAPHSALTQIAEYLGSQRIAFTTPLDLTGTTPFQRSVYQAVSKIPYGETRTYAEIAAQIHKPDAARAVGGANGANPLPILIPCHRLVGTDGSLRGYGGAGGIETKRYLLALEKRHLLRSRSR